MAFRTMQEHMTPPDMVEQFQAHLRLIPEHLREGLFEYVRQGRPVGSFLEAVISGDLFDACRRADIYSGIAIPTIVQLLDNFAPATCYGSRDRYQSWVSEGGRRRAAGVEQ